MSSSNTDDLLKLLIAQNLQLTQQVAELKAELAKKQESEPIAPKKTKKAPADHNKPKNPAHVETGKRLAEWNARRKLVKEAFQTWREAVAEN